MTNRVNMTRNLLTSLLGTVVVVLFGAACNDWFAIDLEGFNLDWHLSDDEMRRYGPSWTGDGANLVFVSTGKIGSRYRDIIYVVGSEGGQIIRWVPDGAPQDEEKYAFDIAPLVNPVTSEIAYATLRHGVESGGRTLQIATAELDGSNYRRLTDSDGSDTAPAWSPNGTRIAFVSDRDRAVRLFRVYIMEADGSILRRVDNELFVSPVRPLWSPDGVHLALRRGYFLYTVNIAGNGTPHPNFLGLTRTDPAWSPDGQWIAFSHKEPTPETQQSEALYISRPDGSDARKVAHFAADDVSTLNMGNLSWSPDGSSLRFSLLSKNPVYDPYNRYTTLHQIGVDGSDLQELVKVESESRIVWSPNGNKMAVSLLHLRNLRDKGHVLLYTMSADGSDKRVLVRQGDDGPEAADAE